MTIKEEIQFKKLTNLIDFNQFSENIISLDQEFFPCPWSKSAWESFESNYSNYYLLGVFKGLELIGFCLFQLSPHEELAHLLKILVRPGERKRGTALGALSYCADQLQQMGMAKVYLEVETTNVAAIELYKKIGLEVIHKKNNFYGTERHAFIMMST